MLYLKDKVVFFDLNNLNVRRFYPALVAGLLCVGSVGIAGKVVAGTVAFSDGVKAFKQKQYSDALIYFLEAEKITPEKNSLLYNLGVTYYKLKDFRKAELYFLRLTTSLKYKQLANYNLGRTNIQLHRKVRAVEYFRLAAKGSRKKLVILANKQLKNMSAKKSRTRLFSAAAQLSIGNDNNVFLSADDSPSQTSDSYTDIVSYLDLNFSKNGIVSLSYNNQDYQTINSADYEQVGLSVSQQYQLANWWLTPKLAWNQTMLGGNDYLTVNELKFSAKKRLSKTSKMSMRYRYSDIESRQSRYNYLTGERHQFRIDYRKKQDIGRIRYRYILEVNDRQDTVSNSYSPTRHTIRLRLKKKITNNLQFSSELGYRRSEYPSTANVKRVDNRLRLRLGTNYRFSKDFRIKAQFIYSDNTSNVTAEEYLHQVYELGLSYYF